MSFNISLRNPGQPFDLNFVSIIVNSFYYDVTTDGIFAKQIVQNSGFAETMKVTPNGIVYIKGVKQVNGSLSKRFELTPSGNLIAKSFTTQL
jgi:hypothetical protein